MKNVDEEAVKRAFAKGEKSNLKKGGRAVIYQRVSSKEQEYGFSPEVQLDVCQRWAKLNDFEVVKIFEGEHESAKTDVNRKRFNETLAFVKDKKNRIDAVIVYSTSRFSRTGTDSFSTINELKKKGITVYSATSSYDARTADGEMLQNIELVQAHHDNAIKSQAVRDAGAKALRSGHWISKAPLGYDMKTIKHDQCITVNEIGVLIRQAFRMKANENLSTEEVRVRMSAMGLDLRKQKWSWIFSNIFYAGYFSHPFLEGDIVKGPHEPLVSLSDFGKINGMLQETHARGYERKSDKEYAPLLGILKCPVCGGNMTASVSTKMRKKYGKDIGYYVCSHKGCRCNVSAKKANSEFMAWLENAALSDEMTKALELELCLALPVLNSSAKEEVKALKTNLAHKSAEIETVEYNLATATSPKARDVCERQLRKLEDEKETIIANLKDKDKEILNLDDYISYGLLFKDNLLKLWELANLSQKRNIQNLVFPDGIRWNKENEDIEPLSRNDFLFLYGLKSDTYENNKNGQTVISEDLSAFAPLTVEILNLWTDFRKVVEFIQENERWLKTLFKIVNHD